MVTRIEMTIVAHSEMAKRYHLGERAGVSWRNGGALPTKLSKFRWKLRVPGSARPRDKDDNPRSGNAGFTNWKIGLQAGAAQEVRRRMAP